MFRQPRHHCPRCRITCTTCSKHANLRFTNSNINIVYAPKEFTALAKNNTELKLRVWSFMKPPKISQSIPIVHPERLEKIRDLLTRFETDNALETHIDSQLSIQVLSDGSMAATKSKTEVKIYPNSAVETFHYAGPTGREHCDLAEKEEPDSIFGKDKKKRN